MSQQLWRLDDETRKAVLRNKRLNRHVTKLLEEIAQLSAFQNQTLIPEQKTWAKHQIKSIVHEVNEINAGRLGLPEDEGV